MENANPSSPPESPNSFRNRKIHEINTLLKSLNLTAPPLERDCSCLEGDVGFVELFREYYALHPIISDNACILCITAAAGTELANAYSPDTVIASSPGKEVYDPWAFYLHAALLRQAFAYCGKFPTAASRRI
ncbi:hypothetical protein Tco_0911204 [Tanacetum coccineum]|uniref:Uncharacterized protein n=1 Tax=Tanacetum coccineum TaxID=301880 RepID=A0ABQ5D1C3_9ASTR